MSVSALIKEKCLLKWILKSKVFLARKQTLRGALEEEGELTTASLEVEYLHRKSRCEVLIGRDDINNDVITLATCVSVFVYIGARFCFAFIAARAPQRACSQAKVFRSREDSSSIVWLGHPHFFFSFTVECVS